MMQKNEDELLDKWINYHGNIFGFDNLYVYDNGSTSSRIKDVANLFSERGVNFYFDNNDPSDFENKGEVLGKKIIELESTGLYEFIIPLDCDEFVAVLDEEGEISCCSSKIKSELMNHIDSDDVLLFKGQYFNSPLDKDRFRFESNRKCFFRSGTFKSLDIGFHWGKSRLSGGEHRTSLVQFHFHNKPFCLIQSHAREKLKSRVKSFERKDLEEYTGAGFHMTRYFLIDEKDYLADFMVGLYKKINCLANEFSRFGWDWPFARDLEIARKQCDEIFIDLKNTADRHGLKVSEFNSEIFGFLDGLIESDDRIKLSGWVLDENLSGVDDFRLLINNKYFVDLLLICKTARNDVVAKFLTADVNCGFEVFLSKNEIPIALADIKTISIYCSKNSSEIGWPLSNGECVSRWLSHVQI